MTRDLRRKRRALANRVLSDLTSSFACHNFRAYQPPMIARMATRAAASRVTTHSVARLRAGA